MNEKKELTFSELKTAVTVKLTLLIGACRVKSIKKSQIEQSLEEYIKKLAEYKEKK